MTGCAGLGYSGSSVVAAYDLLLPVVARALALKPRNDQDVSSFIRFVHGLGTHRQKN